MPINPNIQIITLNQICAHILSNFLLWPAEKPGKITSEPPTFPRKYILHIMRAVTAYRARRHVLREFMLRVQRAVFYMLGTIMRNFFLQPHTIRVYYIYAWAPRLTFKQRRHPSPKHFLIRPESPRNALLLG